MEEYDDARSTASETSVDSFDDEVDRLGRNYKRFQFQPPSEERVRWLELAQRRAWVLVDNALILGALWRRPRRGRGRGSSIAETHLSAPHRPTPL